MRAQGPRLGVRHLALACLLLAANQSANANPVFQGANGAISLGVAPYGAPANNGAPTFIANNVTGRNDVLSSPGGGTLGAYLTASPVVANNTSSTGVLALPPAIFLTQTGGGNGFGAFGFGSFINTGTLAAFNLADSGPGGGTASYGISSAVAHYTDAAGTPAGTAYGAFLAIGGAVPNVGNADVAAIRVHIASPNANSPFFGGGNGVDLPDLVLAISNNGVNGFNIVRHGTGTGLIVDNAATGAFRALAVDNLALGAAIPAGDAITVSWTLTAFADPASIDSIDITPDLLALSGPLPAIEFVGTPPTPEPASVVLLGLGAVCLLGRAAAARLRRRATG